MPDVVRRRGRSAGKPPLPLVIGGVILGIILCGFWATSEDVFSFGDGSTVVPMPEFSDRAAVVPELARAAQAQGICYGWRLDSEVDRSVGSNLGDGVAVANDYRCPRWVEVVVTVVYTPESSEAADSASIRIDASGLRSVPDASELARFGLTEAAFIDEPGDAISQAVLALPLLAIEHGVAGPVPTGSPSTPATASPGPSGATPIGSIPTASPSAAEPGDADDLASAGSDFWRDRWLLVVVGGVALLGGIGTAVWTWFEFRQPARGSRRRPRRPIRPPRPRVPPEAPATPPEAPATPPEAPGPDQVSAPRSTSDEPAPAADPPSRPAPGARRRNRRKR